MNKLFLAVLAAALTLGTSIEPLAAQAPGTPEAYIRDGNESMAARYYSGAATAYRQATMLRPDVAEFKFLLATALASDGRWEEAREFFDKAAAQDPALRARADEWLARDPSAKPAPAPEPKPAPAPAPQPAAPAARPAPAAAIPVAKAPPSPVFKVGDAVEIEYTKGRWIPGIVTSVDAGACPYYRVRADAYGNGNPSNLGYGCSTVRAPTGVGPVVAACGGSNANCRPTSPPPLGSYRCSTMIWQGTNVQPQYREQYHGSLEVLSGGRYRFQKGGAVGRYTYDARTYAVRWTGGALDNRGAVTTYGLDGKRPEFTITFGAGSQAAKWQCTR
jgi:Flp pilus assembly protein TadD